MTLHHVRRGSGPPLLLLHNLGGSWRSFDRVLGRLAEHRDVVAVDLPGFGETPPLPGEPSVAALTDAVVAFLDAHGLRGADTAGSSLGGRIVLELARRGVGRHAVALDPGGFWNDRELAAFRATLGAQIRLARAIRGAVPALTAHRVTRGLLLAQFSARPWAVPADVARREVLGLATAPSSLPAYRALVQGPRQAGAAAGTVPGRITIGWGRRDRLTVPAQARRAAELFPDARLHWFERSGHFPQYDEPQEAARVILDGTA